MKMKKKTPKRATHREDWVRFGAWLEDRATEMGLKTHEAFGRRVGVHRSMISHVLKGRVPIPQERIMEWADKLGLDRKDRDAFLKGAWFSHAPAEAYDLLHDVERQRETARRQIRALKRKLSGIEDPE